MEQLLTARSVSKRYASRMVLRDVSLTLARGECVAVVGANGSGKSTLLRVLARLTAPDVGSVAYRRGAAAAYMPELFPRVNTSLAALLRGFERLDCRDADRWAERFELTAARDSSVSTFSKGMLAKVCAIQAFSANPDILLLDEPMSGFDAHARDTFLTAAREAKARGAGILMASHEQDAVRALADRVLCLRDGMLAPSGETDTVCRCDGCPNFAANTCPYGRCAR